MRDDLAPEVYQQAVNTLKQGGIIAYPTEGVYGLGCDPDNQQALAKLIQLKQRNKEKGLIILAADVEQVKPFIAEIPSTIWQRVRSSWPGPITWLLPAAQGIAPLVIGNHSTIAIRVTDHPQANKLIRQYGSPIVSTSANLEGQASAMSAQQVHEIFASTVDYIMPGHVGQLGKATPIRDALSNKEIRS